MSAQLIGHSLLALGLNYRIPVVTLSDSEVLPLFRTRNIFLYDRPNPPIEIVTHFVFLSIATF